MNESKYAKYIVTDLQAPFSEEQKAAYATFATRILWMDKNVVPGAFQMNFSWYNKPIFHFSVVDDGTYSLERTDNKMG